MTSRPAANIHDRTCLICGGGGPDRDHAGCRVPAPPYPPVSLEEAFGHIPDAATVHTAIGYTPISTCILGVCPPTCDCRTPPTRWTRLRVRLRDYTHRARTRVARTLDPHPCDCGHWDEW